MGLEILYIEGFDAVLYITPMQKKILKKLWNITAPLLHDYRQTPRDKEAITCNKKKPDVNFWEHHCFLLDSWEVSCNVRLIEDTFKSMLIYVRDSTGLNVVVKCDELMNEIDKIKPNAKLGDDCCLDYLNDATDGNSRHSNVQSELENATKAQASISGSTGAPITYASVFEQVKTHAENLDSADRKKRASSSTSSGLKVLTAHVSGESTSPSGESAHSNGEYPSPSEISSFSDRKT